MVGGGVLVYRMILAVRRSTVVHIIIAGGTYSDGNDSTALVYPTLSTTKKPELKVDL